MEKIKHYLMNNGKVIDFSKIAGFEDIDMEDFLHLSMFTSLFSWEDDLIGTIGDLIGERGFEEGDTRIVKKVQSATGSEKYVTVSTDLLYRSGVPLLSFKNLHDFLVSNFRKIEMIEEIMEDYIQDIGNISVYYNRIIRDLQSKFDDAKSAREKKKLETSLNAAKKGLESLKKERKIIDLIMEAIEKQKAPGYEETHADAFRFMSLLNKFVNSEILIRVSDTKGKRNVKSFIRLAAREGYATERYPDVSIPIHDNVYSGLRSRLASCLKEAKSMKPMPPEYLKELEEQDLTYQPPKDDRETDDYMLLDRSDFERLYKDQKEPLDMALENLEEKQGRRL